ncbi:uncharacterized protein LOC111326418 [Stylophora pistillata]|uniref:Microtubule-associated protein Jupiter n=1 Tax=Stylophora pistillata TaxID=50429 RepID=A0A2B4SWM8_STYPI|nr:uncharacterized protein LOC111326418 [Stylophora pistillata]PFX34301.1 hypothetical protein AWC38_SpisGene882 [Stylophora pistillata]
MSSCDNTIGITDSTNISTKVLAPPGGKTSISIFGGDAPEPPASRKEVNACQAARNKSNVFASAGPASDTAADHHKQSQQRRQHSSVFGESNQPAPVAKPFEPEPRKPHTVNPHQEARQKSSLFKEPTEPAKPPPRKGTDIIAGRGQDEPAPTSVKVHAPPGGVSHISFG